MKVQEITVPKVSIEKSAEGFQRRKYLCTPGEQKNQHRGSDSPIESERIGSYCRGLGWGWQGWGHFKGRGNNVPKDPSWKMYTDQVILQAFKTSTNKLGLQALSDLTQLTKAAGRADIPVEYTGHQGRTSLKGPVKFPTLRLHFQTSDSW